MIDPYEFFWEVRHDDEIYLEGHDFSVFLVGDEQLAQYIVNLHNASLFRLNSGVVK